MYAVVEIGGKQFIVKEGSIIDVDSMGLNAKDMVTIDRVLLVHSDSGTVVGKPVVDSCQVSAEVLEQLRDDKIIVFKFKRKTGYKVTQGHRQPLTRLRIKSIQTSKPKKTSTAKSTKEAS